MTSAVLPSRDRNERDGMQRNGNRFEQRSLSIREVVRQAMNDARGHSNEFSEGSCTTIIAAGNTQHLTAIAKVDVAAETVRALAAIYGRVDRDALAHCQTDHTLTHCFDSSSRFVAHYDRRNAPARRSVIAVHVTSADSARCNAHQDFICLQQG